MARRRAREEPLLCVRVVDLTKAAMARHAAEPELQQACLEALARYLDKLNVIQEVKLNGGEGLVKTVMTRHLETPKVQTWGRIVLDSMGIDRHWMPRGARQKEITTE